MTKQQVKFICLGKPLMRSQDAKQTSKTVNKNPVFNTNTIVYFKVSGVRK